MKSFLVDANAFLRFLLNDVPKQKKQFENLLNQAKKGQVVLTVPQIIIFEINFILQKYYGFPKKEIIPKLDTIIGTDYIKIEDRNIFSEAIRIYSRSNLSLTDCFLLAKSNQEDKDIFTFDQSLAKLSKSNAN
jgi:predicted nucleic acid-binding protein